MEIIKTTLMFRIAIGISAAVFCSQALAQTAAVTPDSLSAYSVDDASSILTVSPSSFDQFSEEADRFVLFVQQLETEYGPFDHRLGEALEAAGGASEKQGLFRQALEYYERALHITRINSGLYSQDQISLVEKLINSNIALEEWGVVDNHYRYLHLLYSRLYTEDSPELRRGLAQISDWHVLAINNDFGTDRVDHLREANKLFKRRLSLVDEELSEDDPLLHTLRYNIAATQYHLQLIAGGGSNDAIFDRLEEQYEDQLAALD